MPTRADLYVGDGPGARWLGSYAFDGQPVDLDRSILRAKTEDEYVRSVLVHLMDRPDGVLPEDGWPWPWSDSHITDYVYSWRDGALWGQSTGQWFLINRLSPSYGEFPDRHAPPVYGGNPDFPDMKHRRINRHSAGVTTVAIPAQKRE